MSFTFCDGFLVMTMVEWLKQYSPSVGLLDYWLVLCFNSFHFNQYQPHLMIESCHIEVEFAKCWTALSLFVLLHLPFQAMTTAFCDEVQWKIVVEWLMGSYWSRIRQVLHCLISDQCRALTPSFSSNVYHIWWWGPGINGGQVIDGYYIEAEFTKCRIAWWLLTGTVL